MYLPLSWMKNYIALEIDVMDFTDRLSDSGSHVESVIDLSEEITKVVTGRILEIKKHPNADKLSLVLVDIGKEEVELVTGASNMAEGDYAAVALLGATLPNGFKISKVDLKGIESIGMLCSYEELGYSDNVVPKNSRNGIMILEEVELGKDITEVLQMNEPIIELEITPNRPDCLCVRGMAREASATFDKELKPFNIEIEKEEDSIEDYFKGVRIDSDGGLRYVARVVKDVVIKESPLWMKNALMQAGMRPINNIVDITNYVMLELGQPLHAFDIRTIKSGEIVVRQAREGEKMTTLDEVERQLQPEDLVITDGEEIEALAGIMGGLYSEITDSTQTILIESAAFDQDYVRRSSKRLGLRTEASQRFEKGISPEIALDAANRVCQLIEETRSGTIVKGVYDTYRVKQEKTVIEMETSKINQLLGTQIKNEEIIHYLERLDFKVSQEKGHLSIEVPYNRMDITIPEDIVEEVGRLYSFHSIEPQPLQGSLTRGKKSYSRQTIDYAKELLYGLSYYEIMTYSFISPKDYAKIGLDVNEDKYVKIMNPLGEDYSVMRTTLLPNMMEVISRNIKANVSELWVYEIGNSFHPSQEELSIERKHLTMGQYGNVDFYDLKDGLSKVLVNLGLRSLTFSREETNPTFHPGRCANIYYEDKRIGVMGQVNYEVLDHYDLEKEIYLAELDFDRIIELSNFEKKYEPIIKYPSIKRDIAIVVDKKVESSRIENEIYACEPNLIQNVVLFDSYEGEHIEEGKKSLAYSILFQSKERTLKDEEINDIFEDILVRLEQEVGAILRG